MDLSTMKFSSFCRTKIMAVLVFMTAIVFPIQADIPATQAASSTVYICTGPKATRYHASSRCRGLKKCSGSIKAISLADARESGFTPCQICY